jgi:hypothetical protein
LAQELLLSGWSIKHVQRLLLNSATYQQASNVENAAATRVDAQNRLLWRQNARRLDAESVRDAVLAVSGKLNFEAGGPGFRDFKYTEAYAPIYQYVTPDEPSLWRRSIYRFIVRTTPHPFLTTLDCPDPANLTPARTRTTTALQALTLSNNEFILRQAAYLAARLESAPQELPASQQGPLMARVREAFRLCFQREPAAAELQAAVPLVHSHGLPTLCRMLLNANEFVYID